MGLFAAYLLPDRDEPVDGDPISTALGWKNWGDWVLSLADEYPEAAHLAQEGWVEGPDQLAELEEELTRLLHEAPDPDRGAITAQVLSALRGRPEQATALMVTDGEPGDGSEEDEGVEEGAGPHKFASTHVPLTGAAGESILELGRMVRDEDLADDGRETEPHVTVRYGLLSDDHSEAASVLGESGPVRLRLGAVSVFRGAESGKPYDVIKADVESEDLVRLNAALAALPHTETFRDYHPHATIAYVRAGLGDGYAARMPAIDQYVLADRVEFSARDGTRVSIPLRAVEGRDGLVKKEITNKLGKKETVWVKPDQAGHGADADTTATGTEPAKGKASGKVDVGELVGKVVDAAIKTTKDVASSQVIAKLGKAGKWLVGKTKDAFTKLEKRYGRAGAVAIAASSQAISWAAFLGGPALVGIPIYIPSAVAAAPGAAIAEVVKFMKGSDRAKESAGADRLSPEDVERLGKELVEYLTKLWKDAVSAGAA
jgi:hypothetical protein